MKKRQVYLTIILTSILVSLIFQASNDYAWSITNPYIQETEIFNTKNSYLYNVSGCYAVQASESDLGPFKLYVNIPIAYGRQALVNLDLWEYPSGKVLDYNINQDYSGSNFLLEVNFDNLKEAEIVYVYWNMLVFTEFNDYSHIPEVVEKTPIEELPNEEKIWLESTEFVQASHPEIVAQAEYLAGNETNAFAIAKSISNFTGQAIEYKYINLAQDALTTLRNGTGVCIGKSNLAAALMRAAGIPARILLNTPIRHYLIEFYLHPYGWIRCEATSGIIPCDYHSRTIGFYAYPSDETNSSVINNQHPEYGEVLYGGTDNPFIAWWYQVTECKREPHSLVISSNQLEQAYNLSNLVWEKYVHNLNANLTEYEQARFEEALNFQRIAVNEYFNQNMDKFLENMELSLVKYNEKASLHSETAVNTLSTVISAIFLCFLIVRKKRKKKMNQMQR